MSTLALQRGLVPAGSRAPRTQPTPADPVTALPDEQRAVVYRRKQMLDLVYTVMLGRGVSFNKAAVNVLAHAAAEPGSVAERLAAELGRKGKPVSKAQLYRWHKSYDKHGLIGLANNYKGSSRKTYGWEAAALRLYQQGSNPDMAGVAKKLRRDGDETALDHRVVSYLKSLSPDVLNRGRLGPEAFKNAHRGYVRRESPPVGAVWQGDGHTLDIYLQHPTGKKVWRAELTVWMDVGARYIVGWWINMAESGHSTLFALGSAVENSQHLPLYLHIDNGSGYKNKVLSDSQIGVYERLGIEVMHARPYNAKAKGHIERWFGTMERQLNKFLPGYCGPDQDGETGKALMRAHRMGDWQPLDLAQWADEFRAYIKAYHQTPHRGLNGQTPAQAWATLERFAPEAGLQTAVLPSQRCHIRRESLQLHNREYAHEHLRHYNGQTLTVEYSIHNDRHVRVLDHAGAWICDAVLIKKAAYLPASRLEQAAQKRLKAQLARKQKHIDEDKRRAGLAITQQDVIDGAAELLGADQPAPALDDTTDEYDLLGELMPGPLDHSDSHGQQGRQTPADPLYINVLED